MKKLLFSAGTILTIVLSLALSSCEPSSSYTPTLDIGDRTKIVVRSASFDIYNDIWEYSLVVYETDTDNEVADMELLELLFNCTSSDANFPDNGEYIWDKSKYYANEVMYFGGYYYSSDAGDIISGSMQIDGTSSNVIITIDITLDNGETKGLYYQGPLTFSYEY